MYFVKVQFLTIDIAPPLIKCTYKPNQTEIWETLPGQEGAPEATLQPILFLKKFWLKNSVVLIHVDSINSYSFFPFSDFFFQKSTKNSKNSKCIKNFCQVAFKWATFHHHSSIWCKTVTCQNWRSKTNSFVGIFQPLNNYKVNWVMP